MKAGSGLALIGLWDGLGDGHCDDVAEQLGADVAGEGGEVIAAGAERETMLQVVDRRDQNHDRQRDGDGSGAMPDFVNM